MSTQKPDRIFSLTAQDSPLAGQRWLGLAEPVLSKLFLIDRINRKYAQIPKSEDQLEYLRNILATLGVDVRIVSGALASIPREGPLVVVSNHPFGMVEAFILAAMLREVRPDVKILANSLLATVPEARDLIIPVDPFGSAQAKVRNIAPLRAAIHWVEQGGALAMFPAGEVAHWRMRERAVTDPEWSDNPSTLIRHAQCPVQPIRFEGRNSVPFQCAGYIHPRLRTAMLPYELLNKQRKPIQVRIGPVIPWQRLAAVERRQDVTRLLRFRTELLRHASAPVKPGRLLDLLLPMPLRRQPHRIVAASPAEHVAMELAQLPSEQTMLEQGDFCVLYARADQIPLALHEIGRLREVTFRKIGEGTGLPIDLDRFDRDYLHLILWNTATFEIAGAYRMGLTDEILEKRGVEGLYLNTLFRFKPDFFPAISPAIEMGRSFVTEAYQRSFQPLHLLWKGIGLFLAAHPRYRTLLGPVSISRAYHPVSRALMQRFLSEQLREPSLARWVRPKHPPRTRTPRFGLARDEPMPVQSLEELSELVAGIDPELKGVPILLRQYLKLGGKVLAFNLDRAFSDVVDALLMVDMPRVSPRMWVKYVGEEKAMQYLAYHHPAPVPADDLSAATG